jgi:hypothetical protein
MDLTAAFRQRGEHGAGRRDLAGSQVLLGVAAEVPRGPRVVGVGVGQQPGEHRVFGQGGRLAQPQEGGELVRAVPGAPEEILGGIARRVPSGRATSGRATGRVTAGRVTRSQAAEKALRGHVAAGKVRAEQVGHLADEGADDPGLRRGEPGGHAPARDPETCHGFLRFRRAHGIIGFPGPGGTRTARPAGATHESWLTVAHSP